MLLALCLTTLSAGMYAAAFPTWSQSWLMWIALAPWFTACVDQIPRRAAVLGVLWGVLAAYGVGWWFPPMLVDYFGVSWSLAWIGFFAAAILAAGTYFAAFAAWVSWLSARGRATPVAIACGWVVCEAMRAGLFGGNPWALSAYSQASVLPILQLADLAGPWGIGFLLALVNAYLGAIMARTRRMDRPLAAAIPIVVTVVCAVGYGMWCLRTDYGDGREHAVAIVQGAIARERAWRAEYQSLGVSQYLGLTRRATLRDPDLIVWPENAVSFFVQDRSPERFALQSATSHLRAELIFGGPRRDEDEHGLHSYNTAWLAHGGDIVPVYDKRHLLPLAEEPLFGILRDSRVEFRRGTTLAAASTQIGPVAISLCSEAMYPDIVASAVSPHVRYLINLTNTAWFNDRAPALHHLDATAFRAVEHRRYLVRAASTGVSAFIDPHGRAFEQTAIDEPAVLHGMIRGASETTVYAAAGRHSPLLAAAFALSLSLRRRRKTSAPSTGAKRRESI